MEGNRSSAAAARDVATFLGDALGFWKAVRDVFPDTKEQRCWWNKIGNVLAALPKSAHPAVKKALAEIYNAETNSRQQKPRRRSPPTMGRSGRKPLPRSPTISMCCSRSTTSRLSIGYILRTTNPIESTFATVRLRQRITKGPGSRAASVAMAFKLIESPQRRSRLVNAPHLVALVRAEANSRTANSSNARRIRR
jgi:putative transposase